jgi:predicted unusual protein kinase regulating ubiquinone biosynthesis (AarF/ABC1/UbiB family)
MNQKIADIVESLPQDFGEGGMADLLQGLAQRPVPTGRLLRLWSLGSLQAKIAAGYLAYWLKKTFADEEERDRLLHEAHLDAALKLLGGMGYLRGAITKVGQALASYPHVVPDQWVDALGSLNFEAPPMHFSLLREHVRGELGSDPEEIFAEFETKSFASASLGQVHRARLESGEAVAVKIQYPNIARTIDDDFRNMRAILAPLRASRDWKSLMEQFEDIRETLQIETDYVREAEYTEMARKALQGMDDLVIPRIYPDLSSQRVLTMEYLPGNHLPGFLAASPTGDLRRRHAERIARASMRLMYEGRMTYADPSPGNVIFMDDGRTGLIDFGCCRVFSDEEWEYVKLGARALEGDEEANLEIVRIGAILTDDELRDEERISVYREWLDWLWEPFRVEGDFQFDDRYIRKGIEVLVTLTRKRYLRSIPLNTWNNRLFYGFRGLMHRLGAPVPMKRLNEEETERAGLSA